MSVSIDGLQPEHDERRKPATYSRILKNIVGTQVTIHSTITSQVASRQGYLEEFLTFWSANPAIKKIWFSLFTPQLGANDIEILSPEQRLTVMQEQRRLRPLFPKLDMQDIVIDEIAIPPANPRECIFARTTETISADLTTQITPVSSEVILIVLSVDVSLRWAWRQSDTIKLSAVSPPAIYLGPRIKLVSNGVSFKELSRQHQRKQRLSISSRIEGASKTRCLQEWNIEE